MSRVLYAVRLQAQQAQAIRAAQQAMAQVTWLRTWIWPGWRDANYVFPPLFFPLNKDKEDVIPTLKMESEESWQAPFLVGFL